MSHARLSPSGAHRWGACAGSIREEARFPEPPSGQAAIDGTHSHTLLEWCIKNNLANPTTKVGEKMRDDDGEFTVDVDRAKRVNVAVAYIRERIRNYPKAEVLAEERVNASWLLGRDDIFGTVDVQVWTDELYEIIDYKDGMNPVEVKDNPQLVIYALGVLSRFKLGMFEQYPFSRARLTIVQPKLGYKGLPEVQSYDYPVMDLLRMVPDIMFQAAATDKPDAPLTPGDKQCRFCAAKGSCAALAGHAMKGAGVSFPNLTLPSEVTALTTVDVAQQSADKDPTSMTDEQIRQVLEAAPLMRQFLKGVEEEAEKRLKSGRAVPGFKLVQGPGRRAWALPEEEIVGKLLKMKVPKDHIYKAELVSPAQAEKLSWTNKKEEVVTLSDKQIKMLAEFITSTPGKLTLVPESDGRKSVVTDASTLFSAVPVAPLHKPECNLHRFPAASCTCAEPVAVAPTIELPDWLKPR